MGSVVNTIGSFVGLGGGAGGTGFGTPQSANIINPVTDNQLQTSYGQSQQSLQQQQALLAALQSQNALGNQNQVFKQLRDVSQGLGPNPAQAMLNNSTGQNVANQAAMAAAQRGASGNVGLMARQSGNIGANIQQQAAGQGAAMQANQSMGALGQMGNLANVEAGQQMAAQNAATGAAQQQQQMLLNAIQNVNNASVSNQANMNNANASLANTRMSQQPGMLGGALNVLGPIGAMLTGKGGGMSGTPTGGQSAGAGEGTGMGGGTSVAAEGGAVEDAPKVELGSPEGKGSSGGDPMAAALPIIMAVAANGGPVSGLGKFIQSGGSPRPPMMASGGQVPALVSPGERYLPPTDVKKVAEGKESPIKAGEKIPGKPVVGGDKNSYANDTVPKTLEKGGIVLPRSVTQAKDPAKKAAEFVAAVLAKQGKGLPKK